MNKAFPGELDGCWCYINTLQIWVSAGAAISAHHATLINYNATWNTASCFIWNANLPADHTNVARQWNKERANCAEVARSEMRACNWRTRRNDRSICIIIYNVECLCKVMKQNELEKLWVFIPVISNFCVYVWFQPRMPTRRTLHFVIIWPKQTEHERFRAEAFVPTAGKPFLSDVWVCSIQINL